MVIIWGRSLYGRVDEVPGMCWVSTQFFHLYYIPLIPMGSYAVLSQQGNQWQGKSIGFSLKSLIMAWLRTAFVIAAIAGVITALVGWFDGRGHANMNTVLIGVALLVGGVGGFLASARVASVNMASYERACELAQALGVTDEGQALLDLAYGQIDEREAQARVEKFKRAREAEEARKPKAKPGRAVCPMCCEEIALGTATCPHCHEAIGARG